MRSVGYVVFSFVFCAVMAQNPSPCPDVFMYEQRSSEENTWYGVISLSTPDNLVGVWVTVILDRDAEVLGNWFGSSTSSNNREFTIRNQNYLLEAGPPITLRFFIKYNRDEPVPSLQSIRLNGKVICPVPRGQTTQPSVTQLHLSETRPNANSNNNNNPNRKPSGRPNNNNNNNNEGFNNYETTSSYQPSYSSSTYETNANRRPGSSSNSFTTSSRRPSHTTSRPDTSDEYSREPSSGNHLTGTGSLSSSLGSNTGALGGGLTEGSVDSGIGFFPGDLVVARPQGRPTVRPRPNSNTKKYTCGTVTVHPATPLITHGYNSTAGQWPWHAALYHSQGNVLTYICGGSLISEYYVLTAAHCVARPSTSQPINPSDLIVYLGKSNLKKFGSETQTMDISKIVIHREYNHTVFHNDIALLKLTRSPDITDYVRPICLWSGNTELSSVIDQLGVVVGWGFDEYGQLTNHLTQARMPVVASIKCIYSNPDFFSRFTFDKSYCAGFRNGTSVCNGDSGGGMVFPKRSSDGSETVWQIRGLVSVGVALQGSTMCDPSHYIVFTDVAKHLDWIRMVLSSN